MKKIAIVLTLLSIVIFAALKGSLWYFTKQFVDNKIVQVSSLARITYKEIDTSLSGKATVKKIKMVIPLLDETIHIDSVQVITTDFLTLFNLPDQLNRQQFPKSLALAVSGLKLDLNGSLMQILDNPLNNPGAAPTPSEIIATLGCGEVYRIGSSALAKMGYDEIILDTLIHYDYNPKNHQLHFNISNNLQDMTRLSIHGEINDVEDLSSVFSNSPQARLGKITIESADDSFLHRKNRFCATENNSSVKDYIDKNTRLLKEYLASFGIEPGDGLIAAYREALINPGTFTIEADLSELHGLEEVNTFYPNDLIQFIRLKIFINGTRIDEISIFIDKDKLLDVVTHIPEDGIHSLPEAPEKLYAKNQKKFHPTMIGELTKYNGYRVKIYTKRGKIFKGKINTADKNVFEIIVRLRSGTISYHVPIDQIHKAEVFY
jgi:hypothetical protein